MKNFKAELRLPYALLSAGIVLVPPPQLLLSAAIIFNWYDSPFIQYMPYIKSLFLPLPPYLYASIHRFATIMTVRSIWTKYQYALPIAILAIGAIFGVIYALKGTVLTTWQIKLGIAMFVEYAVFAFIAAILARRIKSSLGASYSKAVNWLIAALFMTSFSSMHELLSILFLPVPWAPYATYLHWTYLVAAIFFAYTGQLFNSIDATSRNLARDTGYIEAIIGVAGLASKVEEIDPLLDELRQVTARMPQGTRELSADDKRILLRLYYKLERYLTAKDPLRTFTQEDVRSHLTYDFRKMLDQPDGSSPLGVS